MKNQSITSQLSDKAIYQILEIISSEIDNMDTKVTCLDYKQLEVIKSDLLLWRGA